MVFAVFGSRDSCFKFPEKISHIDSKWTCAEVSIMFCLSALTMLLTAAMMVQKFLKRGFHARDGFSQIHQFILLSISFVISGLASLRWMLDLEASNYRLDYVIVYLVILILWSVSFFFLRFFRIAYERKFPWLARVINPAFAFIFIGLTVLLGISMPGTLLPHSSICRSYSWIAMSSTGCALSLLFSLAAWPVFRMLGRAPSSGTRAVAAQRKRRKLFYLIVIYSVSIAIEFIWDLISLGVFGPVPGTCTHYTKESTYFFLYVFLETSTILVPVWCTLYQFSSVPREPAAEIAAAENRPLLASSVRSGRTATGVIRISQTAGINRDAAALESPFSGSETPRSSMTFTP